jgi:hypothetical protein
MASMATQTTWIEDWERRPIGSERVPPPPTVDEAIPPPPSEIYDVLCRILGYDIREQWLLAEGYREMAEESLRLSEDSLAAGFEALPPEE